MNRKIALVKRTGARSIRLVTEFSSRSEMRRYLKINYGSTDVPKNHYTFLTIDNRLQRL